MGITGAPFGRTELFVPPPESPGRALARGKGFRVPGGWGVGKKLKIDSFLGHFFFDFFFANFRKMKNGHEIGQICSDWADINSPDSPHRVLDSPGGFGKFFQKIGKQIKFELFPGGKNIFESIAKEIG